MNEAVYEFAKTGKPMIGICLGMQLFIWKLSRVRTYWWIRFSDGEVVKFDKSKWMKISNSHMGWNTIKNKEHPLFEGLIIHIYKLLPYSNKWKKYHWNYNLRIWVCTSAVNKDNIFGFQPHLRKISW